MLCPACVALLGCPVCFALYAGTPPLEPEDGAGDPAAPDPAETSDVETLPAHRPPPDDAIGG